MPPPRRPTAGVLSGPQAEMLSHNVVGSVAYFGRCWPLLCPVYLPGSKPNHRLRQHTGCELGAANRRQRQRKAGSLQKALIGLDPKLWHESPLCPQNSDHSLSEKIRNALRGPSTYCCWVLFFFFKKSAVAASSRNAQAYYIWGSSYSLKSITPKVCTSLALFRVQSISLQGTIPFRKALYCNLIITISKLVQRVSNN